MADRTFVPLDTAAPQPSQVHGKKRQRNPSADTRRDDRISASAPRPAIEFLENAGLALRRVGLPTPVHAKSHRKNRQTSAGQPEQAEAQVFFRSTGILLWVIFPRTALSLRGEVGSLLRSG